jgi:hypothetical protein
LVLNRRAFDTNATIDVKQVDHPVFTIARKRAQVASRDEVLVLVGGHLAFKRYQPRRRA